VNNEDANSNRRFSIKDLIPFYCHNPLQSMIILIFLLFPANNFLSFLHKFIAIKILFDRYILLQ